MAIANNGASCNLATVATTPPAIFSNLTPDCKPIAAKSRRYSQSDQQFIRKEVSRLLHEGIIERSSSPWRAQLLITNENSKKRMVVDYSQTINKFTPLDAYPFPNKEDQVNKIAQYKYFSHLDLTSA